MDSDNDSYHFPKCQTHAYIRFENNYLLFCTEYELSSDILTKSSWDSLVCLLSKNRVMY